MLRNWRQWFFWLLIIAFLYVLLTKLGEIKQLATTVQQGIWGWVVAAMILQLLSFMAFTGIYQSAFSLVGVASRLWDMLPLTFASIFINTTAPTGGMAGTALYIDDAQRRGQSAARATASSLLAMVADYGVFILLLSAGLLILLISGQATRLELISAAILILFVAGLVGILMLGLWSPERLGTLLGNIQRTINKIGRWLNRPSWLPDDWGERTAADLTAAAQTIREQPRGLLKIVGAATTTHFLNVASLACIFLAFRQPIQPSVLLTIYAMTLLFLIVSPTPNGVGVVETVLPAIYTSLGVNTLTGTVINLTFRGLSFWLPLLIGFILLRRLHLFRPAQRDLTESGQVRFAAILTGFVGIVSVLSATTPALAQRFQIIEGLLPLLATDVGHMVAVLSGFALLILSFGLWRFKQTAWQIMMIVLLVSIVSHLLKGPDFAEAILSALLALYLWAQRSHFQAISDPPSVRQGIAVLLGAIVFTLAYGTVGYYLLGEEYEKEFSLAAGFSQTVALFTTFGHVTLATPSRFGQYFNNSIFVVAGATVGYGLLMLLRPVLVRHVATSAERDRAGKIVNRYGRSSLARLTLLPDKSYFFTPGGSVVAFRTKGNTAVALGDPIGPLQDAQAAVSAFIAYCRNNDWQAAFYQTRPDYLDHYRDLGLEILCIGQEAIVDLSKFTLAGSANKPVRNAVNRLIRLSYRAEIYEPPLLPGLLEQLRLVSNEWLNNVQSREKRFSLGWFDPTYIGSGRVIAVYAPDDTLVAFANIVPEYQKNELTIDLMRHRHEMENGTMEFMFATLFQWAQEKGFESYSLGLSPLAGVGEDPEDPTVERAFNLIYQHVNHFYNFQGLHHYKEKFHPMWEQRYLIFPSYVSLPKVALTINHSSSGDSFLLDYLKQIIARNV